MSEIKEFLEGEKELNEVEMQRNAVVDKLVNGLADFIRGNFSHLTVNAQTEIGNSVRVREGDKEYKFIFDRIDSIAQSDYEVTLKYNFFPGEMAHNPRNPFEIEHRVDVNNPRSFFEQAVENMQEQYQMGV